MNRAARRAKAATFEFKAPSREKGETQRNYKARCEALADAAYRQWAAPRRRATFGPNAWRVS